MRQSTKIGEWLCIPYGCITVKELTYFTDPVLDADRQTVFIRIENSSLEMI